MVRVKGEASKPGRRVVSDSAAYQVGKGDNMRVTAMATTQAMMVIIFQSFIVQY